MRSGQRINFYPARLPFVVEAGDDFHNDSINTATVHT